MLYLRTGGNGSGKTLFTLKDVRELQLKTGRPVCHNGRFKIKPEIEAEFGWRKIDFKDWEDQEDGTIFLIDECHYDLPIRPSTQRPPDHIAKLTEHRSRGFDFYLLTQHPKNIDSFVRNLVQSPGWHQHCKRQGGALPVSNVLQWDAVELQCQAFGSGKNAQSKTRPFPREVYKWYDSASLHTGRVRIPKQVIFLGIALPAILWLLDAGVGQVKQRDADKPASAAPGPATGKPQAVPRSTGAVLSAGDYIDMYRPRVQGLMYTAPAYDALTTPSRVPVPAACVDLPSTGCKCYSQDATRYPMPDQICKDIVQHGIFLAFNPEGQSPQHGEQTRPQAGRAVEPGQLTKSPPPPDPYGRDVTAPMGGSAADGQAIAWLRDR